MASFMNRQPVTRLETMPGDGVALTITSAEDEIELALGLDDAKELVEILGTAIKDVESGAGETASGTHFEPSPYEPPTP
ncbi:MAG TPA: hypothetical protein VNI55_01435 [Gaiellaceae bacterium]|nr:hypothetical protein [Gaiellaceae bacterium]